MDNIYIITINPSPKIKTILDFILDEDSPAFQYSSNPSSFLEIKDDQGITNRQNVEKTYRSRFEKNLIGTTVDKLIVKQGTKIALESNKINESGLLTEGLEVVSYDTNAFKARALAELETLESYKTAVNFTPTLTNKQQGIAVDEYPDFTVWIWCRSLANASNNFEGTIINVTPFVKAVKTNVGMNGGNFQLTLAPLVCEKNAAGHWSIKKSTLKFYRNTANNLSLQQQGYVADDQFYQEFRGDIIRNNFLFHTLLNSNDLVFIRFETLQLESQQRSQEAVNNSLFISKSQLVNRVYDMIGLIDNNSNPISFVDEGVDASVSIVGRDLSKLFIEDGSYFFSLELSQGMLGGPGSANSKSGYLTQRLTSNNALSYLNLYFNTTVDKVFKFVINQLSNIKVVPNDLFLAYGQKRNTRYNQEDNGVLETNSQIQKFQQLAINAISELRILNGLNDTFSSNETKINLEIFNYKKAFLKALRTNKVRQVVDNKTIGWDSFLYIDENNNQNVEANTFPIYFNDHLYNVYQTESVDTIDQARVIIESIDSIIDIEESKYTSSRTTTQEIAPGIWQIIKLAIDKTVLNRRIVDSSLSSASGSLMNYFRKVCQYPFVEYFGDTYGDTYNLIVRKPLIDRAAIISALQAQVETEDLIETIVEDDQQIIKITNTRVNPAVINVNAESVLGEELGFDDNEAYTWYHLQPQAVFQGNANQFSLSYLPAIFLNEYAEIWGSKPLQISHNYLPFIDKDADQKTISIIEQQAIEDMRFLIESHAYLPFVRKGSIKIVRDRRHKVGNLFRYTPTGEIFHIDHVENSWSIGDTGPIATTTLQVSRGMIEQLIYGVPLVDPSTNQVMNYISYFNIVDTEPNLQYNTLTQYVTEKIYKGQETLSKTLTTTLNDISSNVNSTVIQSSGNQNTHLLNKYQPTVRGRFIQLINTINQHGYKVIITSTKRTSEEQKALWLKSQNNTVLKAARPGHSLHERGLSIDLNLVSSSGTIITSRSTTVTINRNVWLSTGVPQLAKVLGFKWGGDSFTFNYDPVHFEIEALSEKPETFTQSIYEEFQKAVPTQQLDITKVFSNVKVNKQIFDFFLRKDQFSPEFQKSNNNLMVKTDKGVDAVLQEVIIK